MPLLPDSSAGPAANEGVRQALSPFWGSVDPSGQCALDLPSHTCAWAFTSLSLNVDSKVGLGDMATASFWRTSVPVTPVLHQ